MVRYYSYTGATYIGDFKSGKYDGKGKFTFADGAIYDGDMHNGKFHGFGIWCNESEEYYGEWRNDQRFGQGNLLHI